MSFGERMECKMKTVYIAKASIPSDSANSVHVMKISEAFSKLNEDFELIIPEPKNGRSDVEKSFRFYDVKPFEIVTVKTDKKGLKNRYIFPVKCLWKARKADNIVTRDPIVAFLGVLFHKHTVLDLHGDLRHLCGRSYRMIKWKGFRDSKYLHLVMITKGLADYYCERYGVPMEKMIVLPDGYTAENFKNLGNKQTLSNQKLQIGYCGGFMKGKGLALIQQLTLQDEEHRYNLYGGTKEKAEKEVNGTFGGNVKFGGYVENAKVPQILNEQDILLLPNQKQQLCKNEDIGKVTSPLKMFEYMACGKIIIASDLPVLKEILNEENAFFASPDSPQAWIEMIQYIEAHRDEAIEKAKRAKEDVTQYTWLKRAEHMLEIMNG